MQAASLIPPYSMSPEASHDYLWFHVADDIPLQSTCDNCGLKSFSTNPCTSCACNVCTHCMAENQGSCAQCVAMYDVNGQCGNCGNKCDSVQYCYSCANMVCTSCMLSDEECCLVCLETFPTSPISSTTWQATVSSQGLGSAPPSPLIMDSNHGSPILQTPDGALSDQLQFLQSSTGPHLPWGNDDMSMHLPPRCDKEGCQVSDKSFSRATRFTKQTLPEGCPVGKFAQDSTTPCSEPLEKMLACQKGSPSESTWLDEESEGSMFSAPASTTMMICNVPCRITQAAVIDGLDSVGFAGTYNFVYLPDRRQKFSRARASGNLGYAFVDFKSTQDAEDFVFAFEGYEFPGTYSSKRCTVRYAHEQGFNASNSMSSRTSKGNHSRNRPPLTKLL